MTTIAYDGKIIAADSRSTSEGGLIYSNNESKIIKLNDKKYILMAFSGSLRVVDSLVDYLNGDSEEYPDQDDFSSFAINKKGEIHVYTNETQFFDKFEKGSILATGSGGDYALGAMTAGLSAIEAVNVSKKLDAFSGGLTRSFNVEKYLEILKNKGI